MKKILNLKVESIARIGRDYLHIVLRHPSDDVLQPILPGQFVNIDIPDCKKVFLRRPISVHNVTDNGRALHILVRKAGEGTRALDKLEPGHTLNTVLPLGNSFPLENMAGKKVLLLGGGIGVAPLLYYGIWLKEHNAEPIFLLGARSAADILMADKFREVGDTYISTQDGSLGTPGLITENEIIRDSDADMWVCCGPMPMMKAVARLARELKRECYVSLENTMACGIGACLCCVEKTVRGNRCVCTDGPVFNINELTW